jgi:putative transposase
MDFIFDKLWDGRQFKSLSIVDVFTRECLAFEVDTSLGGERVKRVLEKLSAERGAPEGIVVDNGPEFISRVVDEWAYRRGVVLEFIRPGKPTDNAFVERFHGSYRNECLSEHYFLSLQEARAVTEVWRNEYNAIRPHRSLDGLSPDEYIQQLNNDPGKLNLQPA